MGSLDDLDDSFHQAYAAAQVRDARSAPIFVLLGDELVLRARGGRRSKVVRPPAFHAIKAVAHAPIALFAMRKVGRHEALRERIEAVDLAVIEDGDARRDCEEALARTRREIEGGMTDLDGFARTMGPLVLKLTVHATRIHLAALDTAVGAELARMSREERAELQVVVVGDHQARSRSLGMQYFAKRLPRDASGGERVLYGEGITTEEEAIALVTVQRLDRIVAEAFFGDAERLQSDVLGEAAEQVLASGDYPPIG